MPNNFLKSTAPIDKCSIYPITIYVSFFFFKKNKILPVANFEKYTMIIIKALTISQNNLNYKLTP